MADKLMRAIVTLPRVNGVPADACTNTWYFDGDDVDEDDAAYHSAVVTGLTAFYTAIDTYLAQSLTDYMEISIYDMRDPTPRVPEYTTTVDLTYGAGAWLPGEVAVCLSFQATAASGVSQRRRRGRVYLGPLNQSAVTEVSGDLRPSSTLLANVAAAASTLRDGIALPVTGSVRWAIYSPTTDITSSVDDAFNDVDNGWVDNAFDIQRRRGAAPTLRTTWS